MLFNLPAKGKKAPAFLITDGRLAGLMSRAVLILDSANMVVYSEQVPEIAQEPDCSAALAAVKSIP